MKIKKSEPVYVSFSSLEDYRNCPRLYYWKRVRKLERISLYIPYFIGRIVGVGISTLFTKPDTAIDVLKEKFFHERDMMRKSVPISAEEEKDMNEQLYIALGMIRAYQKRYGKFIRKSKLIKHEKPFHYKGIDGIVIVGSLDNIIYNARKNYVHELKTTSSLTMTYVQSIKTKMQPAMYYYLVNKIKGEIKLSGIIYDVIAKPMIRLKQKETYREYLGRLISWYDESENKFHLERMNKPLITYDDLMNTLLILTDQIKCAGKEKEAYWQNFDWCMPVRGRKCDFYDLCHGEGGEKNEANMVQFRRKEDFKVQDEGRGVSDAN